MSTRHIRCTRHSPITPAASLYLPHGLLGTATLRPYKRMHTSLHRLGASNRTESRNKPFDGQQASKWSPKHGYVKRDDITSAYRSHMERITQLPDTKSKIPILRFAEAASELDLAQGRVNKTWKELKSSSLQRRLRMPHDRPTMNAALMALQEARSAVLLFVIAAVSLPIGCFPGYDRGKVIVKGTGLFGKNAFITLRLRCKMWSLRRKVVP